MKRIVLILILAGILAAQAAPVLVAYAQQDDCPSTTWSELRTPAFAFVFPVEYGDLGQSLYNQFAQTLEEEYVRFASVFQLSLALAITIRIYPGEEEYYCLNALAPRLPSGATHTTLSAREIALIGENIDNDLQAWEENALNHLRGELAGLFIKQITGGRIAPGLTLGFSAYAQDPFETFAARVQAPEIGLEPNYTWQYLWENPNNLNDPVFVLNAMSTVAYLIDVYGWSAYLDLLSALPTNDGYRQALVDTYHVGILDLQDHWQQYFSMYIEGRWRANVFYDFDLSIFEGLIEAGAYRDAIEGLMEAIDFLTRSGDTDRLADALELLAIAQSGQEAGALVAVTRQAIQEGGYELAIQLAQLAAETYEALGDTRRLEEVELYRAWAQEVLDLREEVAALQKDIQLTTPTGRLLEIGQRLNELGDTEGVHTVNQALAEIASQKRTLFQAVSSIGILVCVALIWRRFRNLREPPPPEAQLL